MTDIHEALHFNSAGPDEEDDPCVLFLFPGRKFTCLAVILCIDRASADPACNMCSAKRRFDNSSCGIKLLSTSHHSRTRNVNQYCTSCRYDRHGGFGIWAVRWSADGREILAGTGDSSLYIYDLTEHKVNFQT